MHCVDEPQPQQKVGQTHEQEEPDEFAGFQPGDQHNGQADHPYGEVDGDKALLPAGWFFVGLGCKEGAHGFEGHGRLIV